MVKIGAEWRLPFRIHSAIQNNSTDFSAHFIHFKDSYSVTVPHAFLRYAAPVNGVYGNYVVPAIDTVSQEKSMQHSPGALQLLPVHEVAHRLQISVRQVWRMVSAGELEVVRLSPRCVRFDARSLESLISTNTENRK